MGGMSPNTEIFGWYVADPSASRLRVRVSIDGSSLCIHGLSGGLAARWSLSRLENRGIPFWGRDWPIGDRELPAQTLTLENDEDYAAVQSVAPGLASIRTRTWRHLLFWPDGHGNLKASPAFIYGAALFVVLVIAVWQSMSQ